MQNTSWHQHKDYASCINPDSSGPVPQLCQHYAWHRTSQYHTHENKRKWIVVSMSKHRNWVRGCEGKAPCILYIYPRWCRVFIFALLPRYPLDWTLSAPTTTVDVNTYSFHVGVNSQGSFPGNEIAYFDMGVPMFRRNVLRCDSTLTIKGYIRLGHRNRRNWLRRARKRRPQCSKTRREIPVTAGNETMLSRYFTQPRGEYRLQRISELQKPNFHLP